MVAHATPVTWCDCDSPPLTGKAQGDQDTIYICVDDVAGQNVISYQAIITFDPAVLDYVGCSSTGTISEAWGAPFCAQPTPGQVNVGGYGTSALSGSGPLVGLVFDVVGNPCDMMDLCFKNMLFNAGEPGVEIADSCCSYQVDRPDIAGMVTYCHTGDPLKDVTMTMSGGNSGPVNTDSSGRYEFLDLQCDLDYVVTPSSPNDSCFPIIIMYDAALTAQHVVEIIELNSCGQKGADVDENGEIQMYDAALIAQCAVDMPRLPESHVGEWRFDPVSRSYVAFNSDQLNEDYTATLLGDVDGSWMPSAKGPAKELATQRYEDLPDMEVGVGELIQIPLVMTQVDWVISADIVFSYDPKVLKFVGVSKTVLSEAFQVVYNDEPGRLRAGLYGTTPITEAGELVVLSFKVVGEENQTAALSLERYQLNAGPVKSAEGKLTIVAQIPKEYSLSQSYPNPFNAETNIRYQLAHEESKMTTLKIYNISGALVRTLVKQSQNGGKYGVVWDGRNDSGAAVSSGVYLYRLTSGDFVQTRKIVQLK